MVDTAETGQQIKPHPTVLFELCNLGGVDNVSNMAGNHPLDPYRPSGRHSHSIVPGGLLVTS
jgi:hypothetical protein